MEIYINEWTDKKTGIRWSDDYTIPEVEFIGIYSASLLKAIDRYHNVDQRRNNYVRTIVYNDKKRVSRVIDIQDQIYGQPTPCDQHGPGFYCGAC